MTASVRYIQPDAFTQKVFNPTRPIPDPARREPARQPGTRVVGRKSGQVRTTAVNLLDLGGRRYLVAPRGPPSGCATSAPPTGRASSGRPPDRCLRATELDDAAKVPGDSCLPREVGVGGRQVLRGTDQGRDRRRDRRRRSGVPRVRPRTSLTIPHPRVLRCADGAEPHRRITKPDRARGKERGGTGDVLSLPSRAVKSDLLARSQVVAGLAHVELDSVAAHGAVGPARIQLHVDDHLDLIAR